MKKPFVRKNHVIDASGVPMGRLASRIASLLRGKFKVGFRPNRDQGDFVTVFNASKVMLTGKKIFQKKYYFWSGYPSGLKKIPFKRIQEQRPEYIIRHAVVHMLPKNRLQKSMIKRLSIKQ